MSINRPLEAPAAAHPGGPPGGPQTGIARFAWLPILVLMGGIAVLHFLDLPESYEHVNLMLGLNIVFSVIASLFIVFLVARSYLTRGTPGLLLFGCGVLIWGGAAVIGIVASLLAVGPGQLDINVVMTIHNTCVWLAAICHLAGVLLSRRSGPAMRAVNLWLVAAYTVAAGAVAVVTVAALRDWTPTFFIQDQGGTALRYFVLGSAGGMFLVTSALLWHANRASKSPFAYWYSLALALIAVGLFGIMIERVHGGPLSWAGRAAQLLSGAYMLIAAILSARESHVWSINLAAALRQSEDRYRALFAGMTEGFAIHDLIIDAAGTPVDYRFLDINPGFERLTGLNRQDVVGRTHNEVMPGDNPKWLQMYGQVALTGKPVQFEDYSPVLKRHFEVFAYRPAPMQFAVLFMDITERKRAEGALRESQERLAFALETIHTGAWDLDLVDHTAHRSLMHDHIFGYESLLPQWTFEMFLEHVLPEDREEVGRKFQHAVRTKTDWDFECRIRRTDGEIRWIRAAGRHRPDPSGEMNRMSGVVQDITDRKRAEEALQQSELRFRTMADSIPQLAWMAKADGFIYWYNRRWYEYTGTTPQQMEGWGWQSVHDPEVLPKVLEQWKASIGTGNPFDMEFPLRGADGKFRPFLTRVMPLKDDQGKVVQWFGTNTDVSERAAVEQALRQAKEQLESRVRERTGELTEALGALRQTGAYTRSLIEASLDPLVTIGPDGTITDVNAATEAATGRTRQELIGTDFATYFTEPDNARMGYQRVFKEGSVRDYPLEVRHHDGHTIPVLYNAAVYRDQTGRVVGVFAAARDITERKRVEMALREAHDTLEQRVAERTAELTRSNRELEQFAYISSHDLQEPLRQVRAFVQLLQARHEAKLDGDALQYMHFVHDGAERMSGLVQGLLDYSRIGARDARLQATPCRQAIDAALANLRAAVAESGARVTHDELPTVTCDPTQLMQLFQNLIGNAIKFRRDGVAPEIHVAARRDGARWLLSVRDNGIGIDPQYHEKIFMIFQRLHDRGKYPGTGIGLAISKKIVEQCGGRIWIESKVGEGSTFCFSLPANGDA